MRVEGVVLEDHGHVSIFGGRIVDDAAPNADGARVLSSRPAIMRRAVVLPHPDGPTKTMNSPSWISRSRSKTATVPSAKILVSLSRWISDMDPYLPFSGLGFRPPLPLLSPSYPAAITCKQKDAQHTIFSANLVLPGRVLSAPPTPPR